MVLSAICWLGLIPHRDDNFPGGSLAFAVAVGLGNFSEGIGAIDDRLNLAAVE